MNARTDLGTDAELLALVSKIKGFNYDGATAPENLALAQALKIVAQDTVARWEAVREQQRILADKIAIADVATELAGVVNTLKPEPAARRRWLTFGGK